MKQLLTLLILSISFNSFSQAFIFTPEPKDEKQKYNFIIIWRTWGQNMEQHGDMITPVWKWRTDFAGFSTQKELIDWLNTSNIYYNGTDHGDRSTIITENQFIAAYDLVKMKKLTISFKTIEKSLPKRVEIQAEKWKETTAELKDN
jgi:hypothetical protein